MPAMELFFAGFFAAGLADFFAADFFAGDFFAVDFFFAGFLDFTGVRVKGGRAGSLSCRARSPK